MRRLCVFCGSSAGAESAYAASTAQLGTTLAERGLDLVYGGGGIGLMGVIADAVIAGGGNVIGVIPHALEQRELAHRGVADMRVVTTMHERKALMAELADAFVALPGGIGTLEEFFEVWTWAHARRAPQTLRSAQRRRLLRSSTRVDRPHGRYWLLRPQHRAMVFVEPTPEALLDRLADYTPPDTNRWLDEAAT
ncbi:MAG: TIGR00730 family Rossman fold protein [Pirellulales bacterium]